MKKILLILMLWTFAFGQYSITDGKKLMHNYFEDYINDVTLGTATYSVNTGQRLFQNDFIDFLAWADTAGLKGSPFDTLYITNAYVDTATIDTAYIRLLTVDSLNVRMIEATGAHLTISDTATANTHDGDTQSQLTFKGRYYSGSSDLSFSQARLRLVKENLDGTAGAAFAFDVINTDGSASVLTERMRIDKDGNVGINTTTPLAKLAINGGVHIGGDSDPGDDNLLVDGKAIFSGAVNIDDGVGGSPVSYWIDADNKHFGIEKKDAGEAVLANDEGEIRIMPSGDVDDYLKVSTTTGIITIGTQAGNDGDLVITAGGGDISFSDDNIAIGGTTTFANGAEINNTIADTLEITETVVTITGDLNVTGDIENHKAAGLSYISTAGIQTIGTGGTFEKLYEGDMAYSSDHLYNFTESNGRLTYTGTDSVHVTVIGNLTIESGEAAQICQFRIALNGTTIAGTNMTKTFVSQTVNRTIGLSWLLKLGTNDYVEIYGTSDTSADTFVIQNLVLTVIKH